MVSTLITIYAEGHAESGLRFFPYPSHNMSSRLTIGFDLDMTLVDSAAGICACMTEVLKEAQN